MKNNEWIVLALFLIVVFFANYTQDINTTYAAVNPSTATTIFGFFKWAVIALVSFLGFKAVGGGSELIAGIPNMLLIVGGIIIILILMRNR